MADRPDLRQESLRARLDAELDEVRPDFGAVLQRVREQPSALPEAHVDLGEPPPELAEACDALRARIHGALKERLAADPVPPRFAPRRVVAWVAFGVLAAAVLAFVMLGPGGRVWRQQASDDASSLASDERAHAPASGQASQRAEPVQPSAPRRAVPRSIPAEPLPVEPVPPDVLPDEPAPTEVVEPRPARPHRVPIDERLETLDERAQQRWAAGDRAGARKDFRTIVRIGGRRKQVELAYAELFALARQGGRSLPPLWREYLRRFPKGRYAAEASAGLCRAAATDERAACWDAHRARFGASSGGRP